MRRKVLRLVQRGGHCKRSRGSQPRCVVHCDSSRSAGVASPLPSCRQPMRCFSSVRCSSLASGHGRADLGPGSSPMSHRGADIRCMASQDRRIHAQKRQVQSGKHHIYHERVLALPQTTGIAIASWTTIASVGCVPVPFTVLVAFCNRSLRFVGETFRCLSAVSGIGCHDVTSSARPAPVAPKKLITAEA